MKIGTFYDLPRARTATMIPQRFSQHFFEALLRRRQDRNRQDLRQFLGRQEVCFALLVVIAVAK